MFSSCLAGLRPHSYAAVSVITPVRPYGQMQKLSLDALARELLEKAAAAPGAIPPGPCVAAMRRFRAKP